jgi:ABC-type Fe3+/spermidine/putrescine transport system ATPase subunit
MRGDVLHAQLRARLGSFVLDVQFDAPVGVTTLFGPSGSGKTSTLRAVAGLLRLDAGSVRLNDTPWTSLPPEAREVGYVFQHGALFPHLTVEENVAFGARSREDVTACLQRLGLEPFARRRPNSLSGGEAQRVAIARALARKPRVLLLDEPFSSLDGEARDTLLDEVKRLVESQQLVTLFVTHAREETERLGGRVLHLAAGRVAAPSA